MQTFFAWVLTALVILAAYAWADWFISRSPAASNDIWLPLLVTLALSTGSLTLIMFWEALLGLSLTLWGSLIPYFCLMLPGWWLHRPTRPKLAIPKTTPRRILLSLLLLICAGILFNSVYWPFNRADTLGIYAFYGQYMADNRAIADLPGALTVYEAYPIFIPLTYTYAYLASGWHNEALAALFPALLSVGCLAAVYSLGTAMQGRLAGWLAAILLALTPTFSSWASSGYVDLPMAYFYMLAALFAWRLWHANHWSDAFLMGIALGLAAWTKNAALAAIPMVAVWLVWAWLRQQIGWRQIALLATITGFVAAPWYVRNWIDANLILPPTAWTEQAQQTLDTLFIIVTRPQDYSVTGVVILVSLFSAAAQLIRLRLNNPALFLLLLWTLPFYGLWWLAASYDPRFILMFLPLLCVLAGVQFTQLWLWLPANWQQRLLPPTVAMVILLALMVLWNSVEFKDDLLRNPFMSVEERRATALAERQPDLYESLYGSRP